MTSSSRNLSVLPIISLLILFTTVSEVQSTSIHVKCLNLQELREHLKISLTTTANFVSLANGELVFLIYYPPLGYQEVVSLKCEKCEHSLKDISFKVSNRFIIPIKDIVYLTVSPNGEHLFVIGKDRGFYSCTLRTNRCHLLLRPSSDHHYILTFHPYKPVFIDNYDVSFLGYDISSAGIIKDEAIFSVDVRGTSSSTFRKLVSYADLENAILATGITSDFRLTHLSLLSDHVLLLGITSSEGTTIMLYDLSTGNIEPLYEGKPVIDLKLYKDILLILSASESSTTTSLTALKLDANYNVLHSTELLDDKLIAFNVLNDNIFLLCIEGSSLKLKMAHLSDNSGSQAISLEPAEQELLSLPLNVLDKKEPELEEFLRNVKTYSDSKAVVFEIGKQICYIPSLK